MLITLFTDAGHCPKKKVASYAIWAKANGNCFRKAGIFKGEMRDATVAEFCAIINGLHCVREFFKPEVGSKVIIQTDCLSAIGWAEDKRLKVPKRERARQRRRQTIAKEIAQIKKMSAGLEIEYRHVKGHRGFRNKRSSVNTWCDQQCSKYLQMARENVTDQATLKISLATPIDITIEGMNP